MRLLAGTSGFSYKEWKGPFYPEDLSSKKMLAFYAERLPTVEINNTFYRMPKAAVLEGWRAQVPESFRFVLKASRRITHQARLKPEEAADSVQYLWTQAAALGDRLGPILFQLPPFLRKDVDRLRGFLAILPEGMRAAFEFRHPSWLDDEVHDALRAHDAALVAADFEEHDKGVPVVSTASFGYLRLRAADYSEAELATWARQIHAQGWRDAYCFFKHEDEGAAPRLALRLMELASGAEPSAPTPEPTPSLRPLAKTQPPRKKGVRRAAPKAKRARKSARKKSGRG